MANTTIVLRSSGETGNTPSLGVIANGELSLNYADGILYYKSTSNTLGQIKTTQVAGLTTEIQFNDAGAFGSSASLTFDKTTGILRTSNVTSSNIATQTYIQFGDNTRQYTANGAPLLDSVVSTSTTAAAVPNSVKTAYDHASAAYAAANTAAAEPNALAFAIALG